MRRLRHSLVGKLLAAELAVIIAGSVTLALVALLLGPALFHRHIRDALGYVPPTVMHHLDEAFGQSLALSLGLAIAAAAVTAAAVSWLLATRIVRPLAELADAAERVSHGEYHARVTVRGDDELALVGRAFNEMAGSLASAEERRRRLLSDLAHELRTPLATIDAYLEGLADGVVPAEPSTWQLLRSETGRMNRLSEDIAKVSRAEERQLDLRLERTRPELLLAEAAAAARQAFDSKGVTLELATSEDVPAVDVDGDRMAEVLANLLDNALRHTPLSGTVTLSDRRDGNAALLSVADTGDGLDPAEFDRIFERFYRSDQSRSRDRGGSGIGLTIARALVEAHGGRLWAESDGPGTGTRLLCRLPAASG
jgi:signal transduction histidine kinase